ncbi:MAG: hypothetical protein RIF32_06995 [Leptospirales bacterium]|jgi:hypothetical protein
MSFQTTLSYRILLAGGLLAVCACGESTADPAREYARGALTAAELLWYDGTAVGQPLSTKTLKRIRSVSASSTLKSTGNSGAGRYAPAHLTDADPATAWCEGAEGGGVGQSVTIRFTDAPVPAAMEIVPGYAKSESVWKRNPRVARFRLEFMRSAEAVAEFKAAGEELYTREYFGELRKTDGRIPFGKKQYFDFRPDFTQDMSMLDYDGVRFEILALEGEDSAKFSDACISQLRFYEWD